MKHIICFIISLSIFTNIAYASWQEDTSQLIQTPNFERRNQLISKIVAANPDWKDLTNFIKNQNYGHARNGEIIEQEILCLDGKKRPFVTYIPDNYDASKKTPLIVYLHGGVGRSEIRDERIEYAKRNDYLEMAKRNGWFMVFPFGERSAMWWDNVGQNNILNILRETKKRYNIDDEKVWMTGFSDGASASFHFAMTTPTDFAAFIPLNGHMGVGGIDGGNHLYPANMINTPLHVINTDLDYLYPTPRTRKMVDLAIKAGANIFYKEYNGFEHNFDYADMELPNLERFFKRNSRNSIPHHLEWKTAKNNFGKLYWLEINKIKNQEPAPWHIDYNMTLTSTRVSFGFYPNYDFEGTGVLVDGVGEGDSLSNRMGLLADDIIVKCNDSVINNVDDLDSFKASVSRGDFVRAIVLRNDVETVLEGNLPDPVDYDLFPRTLPSAAIIADFRSNTFNLKTSRTDSFSIYLHPEMIQLDQEVVINVNGAEVYRSKVTPDIELLLNNYVENRDRELVYIKKIKIN